MRFEHSECTFCQHRRGNNCLASTQKNPSVHHLSACPMDLWQKLPVTTCEIRQGSGRGIVIPGGGIFLRQSWVTINMIRFFEKEVVGTVPPWHKTLSTSLPIELWFLPWEPIPTGEQRDRFEELGVTFRQAEAGYCQPIAVKSPYWNKTFRPAGWQLKIQAVAQSSFDEVIYLDSDCYPVEADWLDKLQYSRCGYEAPIFLGDIPESSALCKTGLKPVDSGCFLLKKSVSPWLKEVVALNGDLNNYVEKFYGDKDTWLLAANKLTSPVVVPGAEKLPGGVGIYHPIGLVHRTCDKFTTSLPENTPQVTSVPYIKGDELALKFVASY